ncbi:IS3 family transposase [Aeromonas veronii]
MPANPLFYSAHDARPWAITGTFTSAIFVAFKVDMRRYYPNQLSGRNFSRQDVFDYIEMFYNPKRRHSFNNGLSPVECEKQYFERLKSV